MIALGFWKAPVGKQELVLPPPMVTSCSFGAPSILRVFKQHRAQLARCYTRVVEYRGGPEGTVVLHVTITPDGTVTRASVDGDLEDLRITECLATEVRRWKFPPSDTTVVVSYPLRLRLRTAS